MATSIYLRFAWQARHLATSTLVLRGRCGAWWQLPSFCVAGVALMALGWLWWRAWARLLAGDAGQVCMAGMALGDIYLRYVAGVALGDNYLRLAGVAWRFVTSILVLRGRRCTSGTGLAWRGIWY